MDCFSGSQSVASTARLLGFPSVTMDIEPLPKLNIQLDIASIDPIRFLIKYVTAGRSPPTHIWASPPCQKFSRFRLLPGRRLASESELRGALHLVSQTLKLIFVA